MSRSLSVLLVLALAGSCVTTRQCAYRREPIRGIALTPHNELPHAGLTFERMVDEIAGLGASHLSLVVQGVQADVRAARIERDPKMTQPDDVIRRIIRHARSRGLEVMVFPILWIEEVEEDEWRGTLRPADETLWWSAYRDFILHHAVLAEEEGASLLSVGSELASLEDRDAQWRRLIADVRRRFSGRVLYSANWDHYASVPFWDAVDLIGLSGYYRLTESPEASVEELTSAWEAVREKLMQWRRGVGKPLVFTELGYPSIDGAAVSPWDYTLTADVDLEEQRRCFDAFYRAWCDEPGLAGVFFWNWWGEGGDRDTGYTPRNKPAERVVRRWFAPAQ